MFFGLVLVFAPPTLLVTGASLVSSGLRFAPSRVVLWIAETESGNLGTLAIQQIESRIAAKTLSPAVAELMCRDATARVKDTMRSFDPRWGELVLLAHEAGLASDQVVGDWIVAACRLTLRVRERIPEGAKLTYSVESDPVSTVTFAGSNPLTNSYFFDYTVEQIDWRGAPYLKGKLGLIFQIDAPGPRSRPGSLGVDTSVGPGRVRFICVQRAKVSSESGGYRTLASAPFELSADTTVVPRETAPSGPEEADLRRRICESIVLANVEAWPEFSTTFLKDGTRVPTFRLGGYLSINLKTAPVAMSFDAVWQWTDEQGVERTLWAGRISCDAPGERNGLSSAGMLVSSPQTTLKPPGSIDLVLKPSGLSTAPGSRSQEFWEGELVFEGIPLRMLSEQKLQFTSTPKGPTWHPK